MPSTKERIQIRAMVGMPVTDHDRVDELRIRSLEQPRKRCVAGIDEQLEAVVFYEVAATGLSGRRPRSTSSQHDDPHDRSV